MEKLKVAIFLLVISILAAISLFESYFERGYIGALIAALFILLLVFIVIYILLDDIQFKKFNLKKERKIKKYGVIKDVLKNNTVGGYNVVVSYTIKNKNYQTKSESLFFNPLPLIKEFNIKEIPIYILVNSNKVLIDIDYFSYYMEEKNNQAKYLFNISNKNKIYMGKSIPIYFETLNDLEFIPVYILPNNPKKCYVDVSVLNNEGGI